MTAAVDDGWQHRQGELINMVGDGSGHVAAAAVAEERGERRTILAGGGGNAAYLGWRFP